MAIAALSMGACSDDSDDGDGNGTAGAPAAGGTGGMTGGSCDGESLCNRSINDCMVTTITQESCQAFYDPAQTTCADIAAYTSCNCDCDAENAVCAAWFSCGETCFDTHC